MRAHACRYLFVFVALLFSAGLRAHHLPSPEDAGVILEGVFTTLRGDPDPELEPDGRARVLHLLTTDDGASHELHFAPGALPPDGIAAIFNRRIQVQAALVQAMRLDGGEAHVFYNVATAKILPGTKAWTKVTGTLPYVTL